MGIEETIVTLSQRIPKLIDHLQTEEATKNALILPFISGLGYDVFDPQEVVPEFVADVGTKKGEKVDYAVIRDGAVVLLLECKKAATDLKTESFSQLYRYFSVTNARIAILTNGIHYQFFSDLDQPNKMDQRPFLELDLRNPRPAAIREVRKLAKDAFDLDTMLSTASELKYLLEIRRILESQIEHPDEELVRFFFQRAVPGARLTASAKQTFTELVSRALAQLISDRVSERLQSALQNETNPSKEPDEQSRTEETSDDAGVVTTELELEGFRIVRAIGCQVVAPERITFRDNKTYMAILLDDNNRKTICRLHFNSRQLNLGVFDAERNETKIPIADPAGIYLLSTYITSALARILAQTEN